MVCVNHPLLIWFTYLATIIATFQILHRPAPQNFQLFPSFDLFLPLIHPLNTCYHSGYNCYPSKYPARDLGISTQIHCYPLLPPGV